MDFFTAELGLRCLSENQCDRSLGGPNERSGRTDSFCDRCGVGNGLAIASSLAQAGAKVMLCDIEEPALTAAVERLKLTNADVDGVRADVSLKAELRAAAAATIARYGKVHILVNNAGVTGAGVYGAWTDAAWNWTIDVNLMAVIWGIEIFGPLIEQHGEGGHIVSTASMAGLIASPAIIPYCVTKYGVVAISEALREELAPRGIGVSVLCPGPIRTQIMDSVRNLPTRFDSSVADLVTRGQTPERLEALRERVSQGIDPFYVGELVREGIENDWAYIFTEVGEYEPRIDKRFAAIKQGFDRVRDRKPRW
jgi:NAD(P)-dependent dehydrogenase (short-subunit alcohol dehydrogenase family)